MHCFCYSFSCYLWANMMVNVDVIQNDMLLHLSTTNTVFCCIFCKTWARLCDFFFLQVCLRQKQGSLTISFTSDNQKIRRNLPWTWVIGTQQWTIWMHSVMTFRKVTLQSLICPEHTVTFFSLHKFNSAGPKICF